MAHSNEARIAALNEAFGALVISLAQSRALEPKVFRRNAILAMRRLDALGDTQTALAAAELLEPLIEQLGHFPGRD